MKAHLIISSEYRMNQPSVFILADGNYYGCLIYPHSRNFPQDANYWRIATSSDADRFFSVRDVEYSDAVFSTIKKLQNEINDNEISLRKDSFLWISAPNAAKNSKIYKEYLAKKEAQNKAISEVIEYNKPFEKVISTNKTELRKILLSVVSDEN